MTDNEARACGRATHVPCTSLEPVSLAWRALEARAARIAKVLSSIFDMHDSLRYCGARRQVSAATQPTSAPRATRSHHGHEVRFWFFICELGRPCPKRPPRAFRCRSRRRVCDGSPECKANARLRRKRAPVSAWEDRHAPALGPCRAKGSDPATAGSTRRRPEHARPSAATGCREPI